MPRLVGDAPGTGRSFISKPARGWLHPDQLISKEGITYAVRVSCDFTKLKVIQLTRFLSHFSTYSEIHNPKFWKNFVGTKDKDK
jgi:hypothetical protein